MIDTCGDAKWVELSEACIASVLLAADISEGKSNVVAARWNNCLVDLDSTLTGCGCLAPVLKNSEEGMMISCAQGSLLLFIVKFPTAAVPYV